MTEMCIEELRDLLNEYPGDALVVIGGHNLIVSLDGDVLGMIPVGSDKTSII